MPNPVSWYAHHLPAHVHRFGVAINHVAEVLVPFLYFAPQPVAAVAGLVAGFLPAAVPAAPVSAPLFATTALLTVLVVILSYYPVRNMLSKSQRMNAAFDPLHLVNTYGAFGSITRTRHEVAVRGTDEGTVTPDTEWQTYRPRAAAAAGRALPPPAGLAAVVRGHDPLTAPASLVLQPRGETAGRRRGDAQAGTNEPLSRGAAATRPGSALPLRVHHSGRASRDGAAVDTRARRDVSRARLAG